MENVYLTERGITVTNARLMLPGQTIPIAHITAVTQLVERPNRLFPCILLVAGMIIYSNTDDYRWLIMSAVGILILWLRKSTYILQLETASGTRNALSHTDQKFVSRVAGALNRAIVERG